MRPALSHATESFVVGNELRDCGVGAEVTQCNGVLFRNNRILGALGLGAFFSNVGGAGGLIVEGNVIGRCRGGGIRITWPWPYEATVIQGNTLFDNGGSGVLVTQPDAYRFSLLYS